MRNLFCAFFLLFSITASAQWVEVDSVNQVQAIEKRGNFLFVTRMTPVNPFIRIDLSNGTKTTMTQPSGLPFTHYGWKLIESTRDAIFYTDSDTLFASNDSGMTWFKPTVLPQSGWYFLDHNDTLFTGYFRNLNRTTDGGQSFDHLYYESFYTNTTLHPLLVKGPDVYFTEAGGLMKIPHATSTGWTPAIYSRPNFPYNMVTCGDTLIATYNDSVFASVNDGASWSFRSRIGTGNYWINDFEIDNNILYAASVAGFYISYDLGRTFLPANIGLPSPVSIKDMVIDTQDVYIASSQGTYMRSKADLLKKTLSGYVYYDYNGNGIKDTAETTISNATVFAKFSGHVFLSDSAGKYEVVLADFDSIVHLASESYYGVNPSSGYYLTSYAQTGDFALVIDSTLQDLKISLTSFHDSRINDTSSFQVKCTNNAGGYRSATVSVCLDTAFQNISVSDPSAIISGDTVTWNVWITPLSSVQLHMDAWLPPDTSLNGDTLLITASAGPVGMDQTPLNNADTVFQQVVAAYDPNDKRVIPAGDFDSTFINNGNYFTYIIRFQNTGNSWAEDVEVSDQLSPYLDLATFVFEDASHYCNVSIDTLNLLKFTFPDIFLPDSVADEPGSHGFIRFSIRPRVNIPENSQIDNAASIYFDFNAAINTNTVSCLYTNPSVISVAEIRAEDELHVFPNPSSDHVNITVAPGDRIQMYNSSGQRVYESIAVSGNAFQVPVTDMMPGMYLLCVMGKNAIQCSRILIY